MGSEERWLTFRDAADEIGVGSSRSGQSRETRIKDAVRRLWRAYWHREFPGDRLRFCITTQFPDDSPERFRATPKEAGPEFLVRLIGGWARGRHLPPEVVNERGGDERFVAAAAYHVFPRGMST